jgi:glucose-1-phosphate thymidylyltransferase
MREVIGIIPAAGKAKRLGLLPCSKELFPVGFHGNSLQPKVISHYILEKMRIAKIQKVYIIIREGKWDIPAYFKDGKKLNMHIAYLLMDLPYGVPFTLDQAYPFIKDHTVALGFPDMFIQPDEIYIRVLEKLNESRADVVLGLFRAHNPSKTDLVEFDEKGRVHSIEIKPEKPKLEFSWGIAVWRPEFTRFMHEYLLSIKDAFIKGSRVDEIFVGHIIQAAIGNNMRVESVVFDNGYYIDTGTPEDLKKVLKESILSGSENADTKGRKSSKDASCK